MELRNFRRDFKEAAASQVEKGHNRIRFALAGAILFSYLCSVPPALAVPPPLAQGPGGPILIVGTPSNPFSYYYAEILRAEGMNEFAAMDLADVTPSALAGFDIAILGQMPLTAAQATMFMNWANGGGNLIAMRPDPQLAGLLGLTATGSTLTNAYLLVNTSALPGAGIVNQTIQFHGAADRYTLSGATTVATLYQTLTTATVNPAVTYRLTGAGTAAAFTYDLAQSVIYTRQGNPAWAGEPRDQYWDDNHSPNTTHDMFYGAAPFDPEPDWIDFNRIAIPQADEQQRLLVNLIEFLNLNRKPLPRFWYLPSNYKAVVVMTGDDHALGGTAGRFNQYLADSVAGCSLANWKCIRSTSLLYPGSPLTNAQAAAYQAQGFEVGFHVTSNCQAWTPSVLDSDTASQLGSWRNSYPSIASMYTNRIHCTVWSDWLSAAKIALKYGFRYEMSYSTGPNYWVMDRVGFQSGTGFSMRFGDVDGTMIDVYQGNNIVWDNDGAYSQTEPLWINTLLDNALGPLGYYAAVGVLAHTDNVQSSVSDAVVASAQARSVPVISGQQMLTWLDGRNGSSFGGLTWNSGVLAFSISPAAGSTGLQAMLPAQFGGRTLTALSIGGSPVGFSTQLMKGITYAVFSAQPGAYQATYTAPGGSTPAITAQPASAWTTSGQTATFSVQAAGTALTYQWQSMPNGATGFTSIPGAVSSTYTTSVLGSSDSGTQFQCVISNASGSVVSKAATVTVLPPGVNFVTNYSPGTVRNNFTGWVGMSITVGSTPITVNALGRVFVAGNGGSHTLKIVDASTGLDLPNASVGANMALPSTPGPIYYFPLTAPVTLNANGKYYVVSQEVSGGDQWYDVSTVIQTTNAAAVQGGVYGLPYTLSHSAGSFSYGPVDFQYKAAVSGPTILQQAQSLTVVSGQSATFSIVASGSGLVYQWQTAPAGSSTFSNISGATASTYTIPVTSLSQTGSQFLCMVSNGAGTSTSQTATLTVIPPVTGMGLVTSEVLGTIRNNYSGWVGMVIQVGSTPLTINALGRFAAAGNSGTHSVKIVNAATGGDIPGASATVSMTGVPAGTFAYGNLSTPVTLSSNATYYVLTQETSGGDTWYDYNTTVQANSAASVGGAVYNSSGGYTVTGSVAHSYGPVDIIYTISTSAPAFFVTATNTGTVRNNFTGWVGASVTVGTQPVAVTQLGRFCINGNGGTHTVKLVSAATGLDVPGGSAVVNMAGGAAGFFIYAPLASPVTLSANTTYYLVSAETAGGDAWYDLDTTIKTNVFAVDSGSVYGYNTSSYIVNGTAGHTYGPLDFRLN